MDKPLEAAKAFTRAIDLLYAPRPDHYLERARVLASNPKYIPEAIRSIDDGLAKMRHNIVLEQFAVKLEMESGRLAPALTRIDRVLRNNPPLPAWLVRKAEVLAGLGRSEEAIQAYQAASEGISLFPARRQNTQAMLSLKTRISEGKKSIQKRKL
jgi:tetratricopeptide (TPR) repeat protein